MSDAALYLGIEAGGTRTTACLVTATGQVIWQQEAGPANLRLPQQFLRHIRLIDGVGLQA